MTNKNGFEFNLNNENLNMNVNNNVLNESGKEEDAILKAAIELENKLRNIDENIVNLLNHYETAILNTADVQQSKKMIEENNEKLKSYKFNLIEIENEIAEIIGTPFNTKSVSKEVRNKCKMITNLCELSLKTIDDTIRKSHEVLLNKTKNSQVNTTSTTNVVDNKDNAKHSEKIEYVKQVLNNVSNEIDNLVYLRDTNLNNDINPIEKTKLMKEYNINLDLKINEVTDIKNQLTTDLNNVTDNTIKTQYNLLIDKCNNLINVNNNNNDVDESDKNLFNNISVYEKVEPTANFDALFNSFENNFETKEEKKEDKNSLFNKIPVVNDFSKEVNVPHISPIKEEKTNNNFEDKTIKVNNNVVNISELIKNESKDVVKVDFEDNKNEKELPNDIDYSGVVNFSEFSENNNYNTSINDIQKRYFSGNSIITDKSKIIFIGFHEAIFIKDNKSKYFEYSDRNIRLLSAILKINNSSYEIRYENEETEKLLIEKMKKLNNDPVNDLFSENEVIYGSDFDREKSIKDTEELIYDLNKNANEYNEAIKLIKTVNGDNAKNLKEEIYKDNIIRELITLNIKMFARKNN